MSQMFVEETFHWKLSRSSSLPDDTAIIRRAGAPMQEINEI
nr:hypothetical protein [Paracoccus aestuariivivens]